MRTSLYLLFVFILTFGLGFFGCSKIHSSAPRSVILVTVEGNLPDLSTTFKGRPVAHFTNLQTTSPSVLPAAASLLTGLTPPKHGLRVNGLGVLDSNKTPSLPQVLKKQNYHTGAFLANFALNSSHGLQAGFDAYHVQPPRSPANHDPQRLTQALLENARTFYDAQEGEPTFLWIHLSPLLGIHPTNQLARVTALKQTQSALEAFYQSLPRKRKTIFGIIPLFHFDFTQPFQGMSLNPTVTRIDAWITGLPMVGDTATPQSLTQLKPLIQSTALRQPVPAILPMAVYCESILPWYAFRLPPLQRIENRPPESLGLQTIQVQPVAHQIERMFLQANHHLGDGLIPPYPGSHGVPQHDDATLARLEHLAEFSRLPPKEALEFVQALIKKQPHVPLYHEWLGDLYLKTQEPLSACNAYGKSSELGYNMVYAYRQQAKCHQIAGNVELAIGKCETAFLLCPEDKLIRHEFTQLLVVAGALLISHKNYKIAAECLNRAAWLEPQNTEVKIQQANLYQCIGQTNQALRALQDAALLRKAQTPPTPSPAP